MNNASCSAWLLSVTESMRVAIGEFEMLHIILGRQRFFTIPCTPEHCRSVFIWQGQITPVFDLSAYLRTEIAGPDSTNRGERYTCIVNYRDPVNSVQHGALLLHDLPVRITVSDDQMCELPDNNRKLREISNSCFQDPGHGPIPVLNLARVFGAWG